MHDASVGRHNGEISEGGLPPAQERVTFFIAREFKFGIELERLRRPEFIDLHRVVDNQFSWLKRIDQRGVARKALHGITHRSQVNYCRHSSEVLQQNPTGREGDFLLRLRFAVPCRQSPNVVVGDVTVILGAQQIFQKNAE